MASSLGEGGGASGPLPYIKSPAVNLTPPKVQNIVPVTIRSILDSEESNFVLYGQEISTVCILGVVKSAAVSSAKTIYVLDDNTGSIQCVQYQMDEIKSQPILSEGKYGRVYGAVRTVLNGKYVNVFKVFPMQTVNEITVHALECMQVCVNFRKLKAESDATEKKEDAAEKGAEKTGSGFRGGATNNTYSTLAGGSGFGAPLVPTNDAVTEPTVVLSVKERVLSCVKACSNEDGINVKDIEKELEISLEVVRKFLDGLSEEGLVYSTCDDFHFKSVD